MYDILLFWLVVLLSLRVLLCFLSRAVLWLFFWLLLFLLLRWWLLLF